MIIPALLLEWSNQLPAERRERIVSAISSDPLIWQAVCREPGLAVQLLQKPKIQFPADFVGLFLGEKNGKIEKVNLPEGLTTFPSEYTDTKSTNSQEINNKDFNKLVLAYQKALLIYHEKDSTNTIYLDQINLNQLKTDEILQCEISILSRLFENDQDFTTFVITKYNPSLSAQVIFRALSTDPRPDNELIGFFRGLGLNKSNLEFLDEICDILVNEGWHNLAQRIIILYLKEHGNFSESILEIGKNSDPENLSRIYHLLSKAKRFALIVDDEALAKHFEERAKSILLKLSNFIEVDKRKALPKNENLMFRVPGKIADFMYTEFISDKKIKETISILESDNNTAKDIIKNQYEKVAASIQTLDIREIFGIAEILLFTELIVNAEQLLQLSIELHPKNLDLRKAYALIADTYGDYESAIEQYILLDAQNALEGRVFYRLFSLLLMTQEWELLSITLRKKLKTSGSLPIGEKFVFEFARAVINTGDKQTDEGIVQTIEENKIAQAIIAALDAIDMPENLDLIKGICHSKSIPPEIHKIIIMELIQRKKISIAESCLDSGVYDKNGISIFTKALLAAAQDRFDYALTMIDEGITHAVIDKALIDVLKIFDEHLDKTKFDSLINNLFHRYSLNPEIRGYYARNCLNYQTTHKIGLTILQNLNARNLVNPEWTVWYVIGTFHSNLQDFPLVLNDIEDELRKTLLSEIENNLQISQTLIGKILMIELGDEDKKEHLYHNLMISDEWVSTNDYWRLQAGYAQVLFQKQQYGNAYPLIKDARKNNSSSQMLDLMWFDLLLNLKMHEDAYLFAKDHYISESENINSLNAAIDFAKNVSKISQFHEEGILFLKASQSPPEKIQPALAYLAARAHNLQLWNEINSNSESYPNYTPAEALCFAQAAMFLEEYSNALWWADRVLINIIAINPIQQLELAAIYQRINKIEKIKAIFLNSSLDPVIFNLIYPSIELQAPRNALSLDANNKFNRWDIERAEIPEVWKRSINYPKKYMQVFEIQQLIYKHQFGRVYELTKSFVEQNPNSFNYRLIQFLLEKANNEKITEKNYCELLNALKDDTISEPRKSFSISCFAHHELDLGNDIACVNLCNLANGSFEEKILWPSVYLRLSNRIEDPIKETKISKYDNAYIDNFSQPTKFNDDVSVDLLHIVNDYFRFDVLYDYITEIENAQLEPDLSDLADFIEKSFSPFAIERIYPVIVRALEVDDNLRKLKVQNALPKFNREKMERLAGKVQCVLFNDENLPQLKLLAWKANALLNPSEENLQKIIELANKENSISKIRALCKLDLNVEAYENIDDDNYEQLLTYANNLREMDLSEKLRIAVKLVNLDQKNPLGYVLLASVYEKNGAFSQALDCMDIATSIWNEEQGWIAWITRLAAMTGDFQKATEFGKRYLALGKPAMSDWEWLHMALSESSVNKELMDLAEILDISGYKNYEIMVNGAKKYFEAGDLGKAMREIGKAKGLQPGRQEALLLQADITIKMGNYQKASELINKILEKNFEDKNALLLLAELHEKQTGMDAAIQFLDGVISRINDKEEFIVKKSVILSNNNHQYEAIQLLEEFCEVNSKSSLAMLTLGKLHYNSGNFDKAEIIAQNAYSYDKKNCELLLLLGAINQKQGDLDQSVRFLSEATKANPLNLQAYEALKNIFIERKELDKARLLILEAIEIMPNNLRLYDLFVEILLDEGKIPEAIKYLEEIFKKIKPDKQLMKRYNTLKSKN